MEKKIQQDDRIRWKVVWLLVGAVCVFFGVVIVATFLEKLSIMDMIPMLLSVAAFPLVVALLQKLHAKSGRFRSEWVLRDQGLERIRSLGEREIILWDQIKRMIWSPLLGLMLLYRNPFEPGEKPARKPERALLRVGRAEAAGIAEHWRKRCPADDKEQARRKAYRWKVRTGMMYLGIVISCVAGLLVYVACQSYNWPSVEGKIVSMRYEINQNCKNPMGEAWVSYEYTVAGSNYHSERFRPLSKSYDAEAVTIERFVNQHRQGASAKVYYDPKQPAKAVLMRGPDWLIWGFLLPLGPLFVLLGWRTRTREPMVEF